MPLAQAGPRSFDGAVREKLAGRGGGSLGPELPAEEASMAPINHLRWHWSIILLGALAILGILWALLGF